MTFGSLFAGIGGMDLGLERAGMECRWQVEIDPFARRVLARHWPGVRRHDDVRTFPPEPTEDWAVDLIAGGFPCQDISFAGKGVGLAGERSGLWFEFARVVRDLRPRYVLVENVSALLVRGLDSVLGTLASLGYDAEWVCIPAAAVGAPHIRDRVFILAYPDPNCQSVLQSNRQAPEPSFPAPRRDYPERLRSTPADAIGHRSQGLVLSGPAAAATLRGGAGWWAVEPDLGRVAHGVPSRLDRLRGLGNAVVPQVAEWIGRRIMEASR